MMLHLKLSEKLVIKELVMDEFEIDGKNFIELFMLNGLQQQSPELYKVIKIFKKYGISFIDALAIMAEISAALGNNEGGKNERE